jgi:hypothetical protein
MFYNGNDVGRDAFEACDNKSWINDYKKAVNKIED